MFNKKDNFSPDKEYEISVKMTGRELISLYLYETQNSCLYNVDLNNYEWGIAALASSVVRGGEKGQCKGYQRFVKDFESSEYKRKKDEGEE